jgi:5-methylcytosine-specific restriction endonuclease McrA
MTKSSVCGEAIQGKDAQVDHIVPVAFGGTNEMANLRVVHRHCNATRGRKTFYEKHPEKAPPCM